MVWDADMKQEDNIKMYLLETMYDTVDWFCLVQESVNWWTFVDMLMNLGFP
jgi:hypothetical protein